MLINGKEIAEMMVGELGESLRGKKVKFVTFGGDASTESFLKIKMRVAKELGVEVEVLRSDASDTKVAQKFVKVASEGYADGIVVQLPLAEGIDADAVLDALPPALDIDLLGSRAKKLYLAGKTDRVPPVAGAVDEILRRHEVDLLGKKAVVLGKGRLVGEPVMMLLERLGMPYIALDKFNTDEDTYEHIKEADILVSGIGVPGFIEPNMLKNGLVLIDAGTSESRGKIVGDADPACEAQASLMTPVPGGIGPITVSALFTNLART